MFGRKIIQQFHSIKLTHNFNWKQAQKIQFSFKSSDFTFQKRLFSSENQNEEKPNSPIGGNKTLVQKKIPYAWISFGVATGVLSIFLVMFLRMKNEKQKSYEKKMAGVGKPSIGGPFTLTDHNGKTVTEKDFLGKFLFIYFGFTHCPDICPTELRKMATVLENIGTNLFIYFIDLPPKEKKNKRVYNMIQPLFVSVDPARDSPKLIKEYIQEFHPNFLGVTGTPEEIDRVCKAYRVYKMKASELSKDDYLLDHSIVIYLVDPSGDFLSFYGNFMDSDQVTTKLMSDMARHLGEDFDKPLWRRLLKI